MQALIRPGGPSDCVVFVFSLLTPGVFATRNYAQFAVWGRFCRLGGIAK